jgi:hypothetical protein
VLLAVGIVCLSWFGSRPVVRAQERRLFAEIIKPIRADGARWVRDWDR